MIEKEKEELSKNSDSECWLNVSSGGVFTPGLETEVMPLDNYTFQDAKKEVIPTPNVISSCSTSREFTNSQLLFRSPHLTQLKKDKERLQAMMAHLKSSEPKPAAQPVSTCCDSFPQLK